VLGGLLGVGGGFVMIPLLVIWMKVPQHKANATSLVAIIPIAIVGVLVYYLQGSKPQVDLRFALLLMIGSVVGAYAGARAASRIPDAQLKLAVAVLMVGIGFKELLFP
jgi:uncharacterized membrane protein YfcA